MIKWIARAIGMIASLSFIVFFAGESLDGLMAGSEILVMAFVPLFALALIGYVLSWFRPLPGGIVSIAGGVLMAAFHGWRGDWLTAFVFAAPYIIAGALFIRSAFFHGK